MSVTLLENNALRLLTTICFWQMLLLTDLSDNVQPVLWLCLIHLLVILHSRWWVCLRHPRVYWLSRQGGIAKCVHAPMSSGRPCETRWPE